MTPDTDHADFVLTAVRDTEVDIEALASNLQNDGADSFRASRADLLGCTQRRADHATSTV